MPLSPEHLRQNAAFLKELRRTANGTLSAELVGVPLQRFHHRRRKYPAFAQKWASAVAFAEATIVRRGAIPVMGQAYKTQGGEYRVAAAKGRPAQVKRSRAGLITPAGERAFLSALAATANVSLACDLIGVSDGAIYLRRKDSAVFRDQMDEALDQGYETLEGAMVENAIRSLSHDEGLAEWRELTDAEPPPLTRMTFDQALMVLGMHRKNVVAQSPRRAWNRRRSPLAHETDAAIEKILDDMEKRVAAKQEREARMAAREERVRE